MSTLQHPEGSGGLWGVSDNSAFLKIVPPLVAPVIEERLLTFSRYYNKPIKPIVEFYDRNMKFIDSFNSFRTSWETPRIPINRVEVVNTKGQSGNFAISIIDHSGDLDRSRIGERNFVVIKGGREEGKMKNMIFGIATNMTLQRGRGDVQYWVMTGYGSGLIFAETLLDVKKSAAFSTVETGTFDTHDSSMFSGNLIYDIVTNPDYPMDEKISIQQRGNFKLNKINKAISDFIPNLNARRVEAGALCNHIAEATGADFGVSTENEIIYDYGSFHLSGVTVKQYVEEEKSLDMGAKTSYFVGDWTADYSTLKETGFSNVLVTSTGKLRETIISSALSDSWIDTWNKDIAQQIPVTTEFRDLVFMMTKVGQGSPNLTTLHGHIKADRNGYPTGTDVALFDIPMKDIPMADVPAPIGISNIEYNPNTIPSSGLVWVIFYERGNSANQVRVWHDNLYSGFDGVTRFKSAIRPLPNGRVDPDEPPHNSRDGWQISANGPQFTFSAFQVFSFTGVFEDPFSSERYGRVVSPYDAPWTDDLQTVSKTAHAILMTSAKPKGDYVLNQVFVPENYYFPVGDRFVVVDRHSGHTPDVARTLEIAQSRIVWDASLNQMGTHFMQILPFGYREIELENLSITCGVC
jgi:hypothetical protein